MEIIITIALGSITGLLISILISLNIISEVLRQIRDK